MCEPTTIMMVGMAVAGAYSTYKTKKAADKSEKFANRNATEQQKQTHAKNSAKANDRNKQMRRERGRLRALSAETGLSGISSESVLNNVDFQGGSDVARLQLGQDYASTNINLGLQNNFNQIEQPDYIGTALNTGLSIYQTYDASNPTVKAPTTNPAPTNPNPNI